jgi:6-pyruvoyltetrahydropterin/6-carboxytetrahydropterin synthase
MIRLTREVRCAVDRDWAGRVEPSRPITNSFAGWPSAVGIVPYLRLRATVAGVPDQPTGYLCNITVLDRVLREHAIPHIADALLRHGWRMPAEVLLRDIWSRVGARTPAGIPLVALELDVTPHLHYTIRREHPDMVYLTQQFEFAAAHRLHCPEMTDEQNRAVFGKCNNPNGHGHNYVLAITICGKPEAETGMVLPLPQFETIVKERVIDRLDHKHLNDDTPEFRHVNPSVENIAQVIWGMLAEHVGPARLHRVRVWETSKTYADYLGER